MVAVPPPPAGIITMQVAPAALATETVSSEEHWQSSSIVAAPMQLDTAMRTT